MEQFYTPKEIADGLKLSYRKVLDLIALGELPAYKIGSCYRVSKSDFHEFMENVRYKSFWKDKLPNKFIK